MQVTSIEPRRLRRLIRQDRDVGGFGRDVPHTHGYVWVESGFEQFVLPADGAGPRVTWRRLFSLALFAALMRRPLSPAAARARLHALGQTELDEIRVVLKSERRWLPPKPDEGADQLVWALFGALWCELAAFDARHLEAVFPTLAERRAEVDALLAEDVAVAEVLAATRPADAPELVAEEAAPHALVPSRKKARALAKLADAERRGDPIAVIRQAARAGLDVHARDVALRAELRATIATIVADATPAADSKVERVARDKLVEELLDRLVEKGRIDFPALRDAVARNQSKLADLVPRDVIFDPLLAADRKLGKALPSAHRKAELYRNVLHRLSALLFGTPVGRWLTKLVLIPAVGAFGLLEGLQHTVVLVVEKLADVELHLLSWPSLIVTALLVLALVNSQRARDLAMGALRAVGRGLHAVFVAAPRWLASRRWVRALFASAFVKTLWRFVIEPALVAAVVVVPVLLLVDLPPPAQVGLALGVFALAVFVLRSRYGDRLEDGVVDASIAVRRAITEDVVPAVIVWVIDTFKTVMEAIEGAMHAVEERLRARPSDGRGKRIWLRVIAVPWHAFAYLFRLLLNVFLEPKYNPIKHFPAVTVGHKLIVPFYPQLFEAFESVFAIFGPSFATGGAAVMIFLLPGVFGFFAWELKENWRLYASNRPRVLEPVLIGSHGETMRRLLRPGFHSGTLPKVFKKLRRNLARAPSRYRDARIDKAMHERAHVAESIERFVTREILAFDEHARSVARVELASNRVRVHLDDQTVVTFEEQSGLILGDVSGSPQSRLCDALRGAWPKAAVDYLRRDLEQRVGHPRYDIDERGLVDLDSDMVKSLPDLRVAPSTWPAWRSQWGA